MEKETMSIECSRGFQYSVDFEYHPRNGFTDAIYEGRPIGQCNLNKLTEPFSDDDREWEMYEDQFAQWKDATKLNLIPECIRYFDNL